MRLATALAALTLTAAVVGLPAASAAPPRADRPCFPATAEQNLTRAIPVVPGYCLIGSHTSRPEPGTGNRGVLTKRGNVAIVRIYRAGAWSRYVYRLDRDDRIDRGGRTAPR